MLVAKECARLAGSSPSLINAQTRTQLHKASALLSFPARGYHIPCPLLTCHAPAAHHRLLAPPAGAGGGLPLRICCNSERHAAMSARSSSTVASRSGRLLLLLRSPLLLPLPLALLLLELLSRPCWPPPCSSRSAAAWISAASSCRRCGCSARQMLMSAAASSAASASRRAATSVTARAYASVRASTVCGPGSGKAGALLLLLAAAAAATQRRLLLRSLQRLLLLPTCCCWWWRSAAAPGRATVANERVVMVAMLRPAAVPAVGCGPGGDRGERRCVAGTRRECAAGRWRGGLNCSSGGGSDHQGRPSARQAGRPHVYCLLPRAVAAQSPEHQAACKEGSQTRSLVMGRQRCCWLWTAVNARVHVLTQLVVGCTQLSSQQQLLPCSLIRLSHHTTSPTPCRRAASGARPQ